MCPANRAGITKKALGPWASRPLDPCGAPALRVDELAPHGTARAQRVAGLALEQLAIGAVLPRRISRIFLRIDFGGIVSIAERDGLRIRFLQLDGLGGCGTSRG